jgi:hypothetical protein
MVGSVRTKLLLVKETLNPAAQADLIGTVLGANGPAHFAMPAASERHDSRPCHSSRDETDGPLPTRLLLLFLFTHGLQPVAS